LSKTNVSVMLGVGGAFDYVWFISDGGCAL
jgi:hypothetical protein